MSEPKGISKSEEKKAYILQQAYELFVEKGFYAVTMSDIVERCEISRGGLYRYYTSTEQLFRELIRRGGEADQADFAAKMEQGVPFADILERFLAMQHDELKQIGSSLTQAAYEFFLAHREAEDRELLRDRHGEAGQLLSGLIRYGIERGEVAAIAEKQAAAAAEHLLVCLEGLRILALAADLDEHFLKTQLEFAAYALTGATHS